MGDGRNYRESGGFDQYHYHQVGDTITSSNGVQGKIIEKKDSSKEYHDGLPMYANTSEVYFKISDKTKKIEQARIYANRKVALDFDWGHSHKEFEEGVVHVHVWYKNKNDDWVRSKHPRMMNNFEMKRYGELLKLADSDVKLR